MNSINSADEGLVVPLHNGTYTVGPKCEVNYGYWVCTNHSETFAYQLGKDAHIHRGRHVLAWMCANHGLEVP
jgi:hypothetical protein